MAVVSQYTPHNTLLLQWLSFTASNW
jgi:hypothetical protein